MPATICLSGNTLYYPNGGGHLWVYLNWALGFQELGCKVIWLEGVNSNTSASDLSSYVTALKEKLAVFGLANNLALWCRDDEQSELKNLQGCMSLQDAADQTDLLINQYYGMPQNVVHQFKKTVLLDIDPGLTQVWMQKKYFAVAVHDLYFTIGETVGLSGSKIPGLRLSWIYTPPCVSLRHWTISKSLPGAPYTTVSHWNMELWEEDDGEVYCNDKKNGFIPYVKLPAYVDVPLELALCLGVGEEGEKRALESEGWKIQDSQILTATPEKYQQYIQGSRGEFSCVKPSCVRLQNAWISDRTICYLASGKPAIVEHTGDSTFLPGDSGLFRFKNFNEAIQCIEKVELDYDKHSKLARALVEEYFDAKKVAMNLLKKCL